MSYSDLNSMTQNLKVSFLVLFFAPFSVCNIKALNESPIYPVPKNHETEIKNYLFIRKV